MASEFEHSVWVPGSSCSVQMKCSTFLSSDALRLSVDIESDTNTMAIE